MWLLVCTEPKVVTIESHKLLKDTIPTENGSSLQRAHIIYTYNNYSAQNFLQKG